MTYEQAAALSRATNSGWIGGALQGIYVEMAERWTLEWDHMELDDGVTVLDATLRGESAGRW